MGFISFNEKYYCDRLEDFENKTLSSQDIYEAKQLLKVLDDLADEGYTNLNYCMERDFLCLTRLRNLLKNAGVSPFIIDNKVLINNFYSSQEYELSDLIDKLIELGEKSIVTPKNSFIKSIYQYSEWIGHEDETAYIFLLRDTLLPYVYFRSRRCKNIYPWLVGRRFLEKITKVENVDDDIRLPIYEALEFGHLEFKDFCDFCRDKMLAVLDKHVELKKILVNLLTSIKENKIIIVESGYVGTIPIMLKSLDNRVNFKLYTTAPFLYQTYKQNIFCRRYEDMRRFETSYSQDQLFQYSSYRDGKFYVNISEDEEVKTRALEEIKYFI